jgi:hypothetical protein
MQQRVEKSEKPEKPETIVSMKGSGMSLDIPMLNIQRMEVLLIGDTPLIMHKWSEKAKKEMRDKQTGKARAAKGAKDPERDFQESIYRLPGVKKGERDYAFPAIAFKDAAVTACTSIGGVTKVAARQAFHVEGEYVAILGSEPRMREDMVRVGMGTADLRYRAEFFPWFAKIRIAHNANVMSAEQIVNMLNAAGFGVGIGDWRPEKNGQNGRFHAGNEQEIAQLLGK